MKNKKKEDKFDELRELRYNRLLSMKELASHFKTSERTIYRWLKQIKTKIFTNTSSSKDNRGRPKKYLDEIFDRIKELKEEIPHRSGSLIHKSLKCDFPTTCPSITTIRKYLRDQGLNSKKYNRKQGYVKFERDYPNDLWQIDVAGVQTIGHLGKLYLIALLDDCSRFIVAAEYFKNQKGSNVIKVIRDAIIAYGRPNQILADNGAQFRNVLGDLGTKYTKLLEYLEIQPIFAKPHHPQTKGKLERFFGTVKQMFLAEARYTVALNPHWTLLEFNLKLKEWIHWYNTQKSHRSLPNRAPPIKRFLDTKERIFHPLRAKVNWDRWFNELTQRKVNKYNQISYKAQTFEVPPGYSGSRIDVIEYENKIEFYFKEKLIITHTYEVTILQKKKRRKISKNGTIMYKGSHLTVDYKLAGKTVEVQEINEGRQLLVYLHSILIKTLNL